MRSACAWYVQESRRLRVPIHQPFIQGVDAGEINADITGVPAAAVKLFAAALSGLGTAAQQAHNNNNNDSASARQTNRSTGTSKVPPPTEGSRSSDTSRLCGLRLHWGTPGPARSPQDGSAAHHTLPHTRTRSFQRESSRSTSALTQPGRTGSTAGRANRPPHSPGPRPPEAGAGHRHAVSSSMGSSAGGGDGDSASADTALLAVLLDGIRNALLRSVESVHTLELTSFPMSEVPEKAARVLHAIAMCSNIAVLRLDRCSLTAASLTTLTATSRTFGQLREVSLADCGLTDRCQRSIVSFLKLHRDYEVEAAWSRSWRDGEDMAMHSTTSTSLSLSLSAQQQPGAGPNSAGASVRRQRRLRGLQRLNLSGNALGDATLMTLVHAIQQTANTSLKVLDLSRNRITTSGLQRLLISGMLEGSGLQTLDLSNNPAQLDVNRQQSGSPQQLRGGSFDPYLDAGASPFPAESVSHNSSENVVGGGNGPRSVIHPTVPSTVIQQFDYVATDTGQLVFKCKQPQQELQQQQQQHKRALSGSGGGQKESVSTPEVSSSLGSHTPHQLLQLSSDHAPNGVNGTAERLTSASGNGFFNGARQPPLQIPPAPANSALRFPPSYQIHSDEDETEAATVVEMDSGDEGDPLQDGHEIEDEFDAVLAGSPPPRPHRRQVQAGAAKGRGRGAGRQRMASVSSAAGVGIRSPATAGGGGGGGQRRASRPSRLLLPSNRDRGEPDPLPRSRVASFSGAFSPQFHSRSHLSSFYSTEPYARMDSQKSVSLLSRSADGVARRGGGGNGGPARSLAGRRTASSVASKLRGSAAARGPPVMGSGKKAGEGSIFGRRSRQPSKFLTSESLPAQPPPPVSQQQPPAVPPMPMPYSPYWGVPPPGLMPNAGGGGYPFYPPYGLNMSCAPLWPLDGSNPAADEARKHRHRHRHRRSSKRRSSSGHLEEARRPTAPPFKGAADTEAAAPHRRSKSARHASRAGKRRSREPQRQRHRRRHHRLPRWGFGPYGPYALPPVGMGYGGSTATSTTGSRSGSSGASSSSFTRSSSSGWSPSSDEAEAGEMPPLGTADDPLVHRSDTALFADDSPLTDGPFDPLLVSEGGGAAVALTEEEEKAKAERALWRERIPIAVKELLADRLQAEPLIAEPFWNTMMTILHDQEMGLTDKLEQHQKRTNERLQGIEAVMHERVQQLQDSMREVQAVSNKTNDALMLWQATKDAEEAAEACRRATHRLERGGEEEKGEKDPEDMIRQQLVELICMGVARLQEQIGCATAAEQKKKKETPCDAGVASASPSSNKANDKSAGGSLLAAYATPAPGAAAPVKENKRRLWIWCKTGSVLSAGEVRNKNGLCACVPTDTWEHTSPSIHVIRISGADIKPKGSAKSTKPENTQKGVTMLKFNNDGDMLFSSSRDTNCSAVGWLYDEHPTSMLGSYTTIGVGDSKRTHDHAMVALDVNRYSTLLATASAGEDTLLWSVETGTLLGSINREMSSGAAVEFSHDDRMLMLATKGRGTVRSAISIYNLPFEAPPIGEPIAPTKTVFNPYMQYESSNKDAKITFAAWGPTNDTIYFSEGGSIHVLDVETMTVKQSRRVHEGENAEISRFKFDANYLNLATASKDCTAHLLDHRDLNTIQVYQSDVPINDISINPHSDHVILGGGMDAQDVTTQGGVTTFEVKFYHKIHGQQLGQLRCHFGTITAMSFHPDGKGFCSGSYDGLIKSYRFSDEVNDAPGARPIWAGGGVLEPGGNQLHERIS
eukprot:gene8140-5674_t